MPLVIASDLPRPATGWARLERSNLVLGISATGPSFGGVDMQNQQAAIKLNYFKDDFKIVPRGTKAG